MRLIIKAVVDLLDDIYDLLSAMDCAGADDVEAMLNRIKLARAALKGLLK